MYKPICPGDQEPLETLTPALREVVVIRTKAREQVEKAIQVMQIYTVTVLESEFIRLRNEEYAKLVPLPMSQEDIDNYLYTLTTAKKACYSTEILHDLLFYRMELLDILRVSKAVTEIFRNLALLIQVARQISARQYAVQRRMRHPWCFTNYIRATPPASPVQPSNDEPDWDDSEPAADLPQQADTPEVQSIFNKTANPSPIP